MKENKKLETSKTEVVAEIPFVQITDNRKEITELTESELKDLENATKQFEKGSYEHLKYLRMNFKHIGGEIPKDVPFTEYSNYINRNFSVRKPKEEWTDKEYKIDNAQWKRLLATAHLLRWGEQKKPLTDKQKRFMERIRIGIDFDVDSTKELMERLQ